MEGMVGWLDKLAVPDHLSPEILVEWVQKPFPVFAAVVLAPFATEIVSRGVLACLRQEPFQAVEMAGGHFLSGAGESESEKRWR